MVSKLTAVYRTLGLELIKKTVNKPINYYRWLELIILSPSDAAYTINVPLGENAVVPQQQAYQCKYLITVWHRENFAFYCKCGI